MLLDKGLIGHSLLAIIAVATAYAAWRAPSAADPTQQRTVVIDAAPQHITSLRWEDSDHHVSITRQADGTSQVTVETLPKEDQPASSFVFPGSPNLPMFWQAIAPLHAARMLGAASDEQLKTMGLQPAQHTLRVDTHRGIQSVAIGNVTYGSGDFYARIENGPVFLLSASTIAPLRYGAKTLQDRRVLRIARADINTVAVATPTQQREFTQRLGDDPQRAYFADPAEPDHKLEQATRWIPLLLDLNVAQTTVAEPTTIPPSINVVFHTHDGKTYGLALWPGESVLAQATSSQLAQPVTVSKISADGILRDLDGVMQERQ